MAKETIKSIRDAELAAQEILKKAESEKNSLIENAKAQGAKFAEEVIGKAKEQAKAELAKVEATRPAALDAAQEKAEGIIKQFMAAAEPKREEAVRLVIDEIA